MPKPLTLMDLVKDSPTAQSLLRTAEGITAPEEETRPPTALPFFPGGDLLKRTPDFAREPITPEQFSRYKAAKTSIQRVRQQAAANPAFAQIVQEAEENDQKTFMSTLTGTLFDALQVGQFTVAGAAEELIRGGAITPGIPFSPYALGQAFERSAMEFMTALPGDYEFVENWYKTHDRQPRASWTRILNDHQVFGDMAYSRYGTALVGFLLDVFTDPTTYTGLGIGKAFVQLSRLGGMTRLLSAAEKAGITSAGKVGELFLPHFRQQQWGLQKKTAAPAGLAAEATRFIGELPDPQESVNAYLGQLVKLRGAQEQGAEGIRETVRTLMAATTEQERRLITLFVDQPQAMERVFNNYFDRQGITGDDREAVLKGIQMFKDTWKDWGSREVKEGLLSKLLPNYNPKRDPLTSRSKRQWRQFIATRGKDDLAPEEAAAFFSEMLTGTEKAPFQKAQVYKTAQERIAAAYPTELDAGLATLQRGYEHIRKITTQRFLHSTLQDPQISRRIEDVTLLKDPQFLAELRQRGYQLIDWEKMRPLSADEAFKLGPEEAFKAVFSQAGGVSILPTPILQDLTRAEKIVTNPSDWQLLWRSFVKTQGLWKGYALATPGYHATNMQSNFFMNWLKGITNPKFYAQGISIQAGGTDNLPRGVRQMVESLIGRKTADDVLFVDLEGKARTSANLLQEAKDVDLLNIGQYSRELDALDAERFALTEIPKLVRQRELSRSFDAVTAWRTALEQAGVANADAIARIAGAWVHTRALQENIPVEEYLASRLQSITKSHLGPTTVPTGDVLLQGKVIDLRKRLGAPARQATEVGLAQLQRELLGEGARFTVPKNIATLLRQEDNLGFETVGAAGGAILQHADFARRWDLTDPAKIAILNRWRNEVLVTRPDLAERQLLAGKEIPREASLDFSSPPIAFRTDVLLPEQAPLFKERSSIVGAKEAPKEASDDMVRLYRGDTSGPPSEIAEWIRQEPVFQKTIQASGRWFTSSLAEARRYASEGTGKITFIDVPAKEVAQWQALSNLEAKNFVHYTKRSATITDEFFLPPEWAAKAKPLVDPLADASSWEATLPGARVLRPPRQAMAYARSPQALTTTLGLPTQQVTRPDGATYWLREGFTRPQIGKIEDELAQAQQFGQAFTAGKVTDEQILQSFQGLLPQVAAEQALAGQAKFPVLVRDLYRRGRRAPEDAQYLSPQAIRRQLVEASLYSAETISRHMLDAGFEVLSLDRYQLRHLWGAWSPEMARKTYGVADVSQGLRLDDQASLAAVEALEDGLRERVGKWYAGHGITGGLARFQRETTSQLREVEAAQQVMGVLRDVPELKQLGKAFGQTRFTHDFGAEQVFLPERVGERRWFLLSDTAGQVYKFTPEQYQILHKVFKEKVTTNLHDPVNQQRIFDHAATLQGKQRQAERLLPFSKLPNLDARFYDDAVQKYAQGRLSATELELLRPTAKKGVLPQRRAGAIQGAAQFLADGKAIIHLFETADESTIFHELAHLMRRDLPPETATVIEQWAGIKNGNWASVKGREAEERFARAFERYVREGQAPLATLEEPFNAMAQRMEDIYHQLRGSDINVRMNDEVRKTFDNLLGQSSFTLSPEHRRIFDEALSLKEETGKLRRLQEASGRIFGTRGVLMKYNRLLGNAIENNARLAHFVGKMQPRRKPIARLRGKFAEAGAEAEFAGMTAAQAAQSARVSLVDYASLTDFEREVMRNIVPFYTWQRKSIPLLLRAMVTDPGRFAKIPKLINATESITEEWEDIPTPDYFQEINAIRLPLILNSQPVYYNPRLPFQDLNRMNWKDILGSITPFAKIATEWFPQRGYSLFLDRPIEKYPGQPSDVLLTAQRALGPEAAPVLNAIPDFLLPKTKKGEQLQSTLIPPLAKVESALRASGATQPGQEISGTKLAMNLLGQTLGLKTIPVDVRQQLRGHAYRTEELLKNARMKAKELGIVLPEVKQDNRSRRRRPKLER